MTFSGCRLCSNFKPRFTLWRKTIPTIFNISLARFPLPAKLLFTAVLLTLGTGYIFAISNIALKVGFAPDEVATKYYGNEASRQALEEIEAADPSGEASIEEGEEIQLR